MAQLKVTNADGLVQTVEIPDNPTENDQLASLLTALASEVTAPDQLRVDIIAELPVGTKKIGSIDIASALPAGDNNIGNVDVATLPAPPSAFFSGTKAVAAAGTQEALASAQTLTKGVTIKALSANTGTVYVQVSGATAGAGFQLAAGEEVFIAVADLATVFLDVETTGEGVSYIAS